MKADKKSFLKIVLWLYKVLLLFIIPLVAGNLWSKLMIYLLKALMSWADNKLLAYVGINCSLRKGALEVKLFFLTYFSGKPTEQQLK
jgi:hypothetical protein